VSARAPEVSFESADGGDVTTSQLVAGSSGLLVLLVFFKASCPTCKLSWPYLQKLHASYGGKSVRIVGVAQDSADVARAFYSEFGAATFELVVDAAPYAASNAFDVESVPHLSLLSPDGSFENLYEGWSKDSLEALGARLANAKGLTPAELVAPGDPVPVFKPG
jgi:peroxiredoxin